MNYSKEALKEDTKHFINCYVEAVEELVKELEKATIEEEVYIISNEINLAVEEVIKLKKEEFQIDKLTKKEFEIELLKMITPKEELEKLKKEGLKDGKEI